MKRLTKLFLILAAVALMAGPVAPPPSIADLATLHDEGKIAIESLDDLPVHTYAVKSSVSDLLASDEEFAAFAAQVRADIESDLATYQIDDKATLQRFYGMLVSLDLLEGNYDAVLKGIDKMKELEDKEAIRLTTGLTARSLIVAREKADPAENIFAYHAAFRMHLAKLANALPWDVVQDRIQSSKGRMEIFSENLFLGMVQSQLDPIAAKSGEISGDLAAQVVGIKSTMKMILPLRQEIITVYGNLIDAHTVEKEDIWAARDVQMDPGQDLEPVVIGIWDSGMDCPVFGKQMYVNAREKLDGKDSDGNGYVDDVHGIAYGLDGRATSELLHPLDDVGDRVHDAMTYLKGFMDLQAAVDSPESSELKKHISELQPEEVNQFLTELSFAGLYAHGTHVAGIASAGNPYARLLNARITFDYHPIPQPVTVEIAKRHAESYHETVKYFRDHGVRVVNMSWGWTFKEIEGALEANAIGESGEARAEMAREIIGILSDGLRGAMESTPEILYVSAAGNDDSDVEFDVVIPSSYEMDNLLVVGAVDQAGTRTAFTSEGGNVVVYANGFEVDSYVPGGERMPLSGTSMASPNAANLAAKLVTLEPRLTPERTIGLIKEGADALEDQPELKLLNPKASVELLQGGQM